MLNFREKFIQFLARSMKGKLNKRRGFTIVEIIVAVVIMSALMTIVMRSLQRAQTSAKRSTYQARVREDAVVFAQEAKRIIDDGVATTKDVANILNGYHAPDPGTAKDSYTFSVSKGILTVSPGTALKKIGVHEEKIKIQIN